MRNADKIHMGRVAELPCACCGTETVELHHVREEWKKIPIFSDYEVSSFGRVRSIDRIEMNSLGISRALVGRVLKLQKSTRGYLSVCIKDKPYRVHRLVAMAFLGSVDGLEVNHKNGVRDDNNLCNLEICTRSENQKHSFRVLGNKAYQPCKGKFGSLHHRSKPVKAIEKHSLKETIYEGLHDAQRKTGLDVSNISAACRGVQKTCGGFIWRFV